MTSSIINLVIDGFLSNLIEIDKSQTYASLLSGVLELRNVKIKKECFGYINLPYFKIEKGYIGKIKLEMQMPFFYSYPINIYINDIFILIKQKNIDNLDEKEEIKSLKNFKNNKLFTEENIFNNLETIENAANNNDSYINQIIKNIRIDIKNIMIRFEDKISNPVNPYNFGIILKEIKINSNDKNNINNTKSDFIYKKIKIYDLNIFMDVMNNDNYNDINYDKLIDLKIKELLSLEMINYLKEDLDFYVYCLTELNNNNIKHDFILEKINLDINLVINYNLDNNNPKFELSCDEIEKFEIQLTLGQISNFFLVLSYYNLFYYFQIGLSKKIFNKKLSNKEKEKYIYDYMKYYYNKYKLKIPDSENNFLKKFEENVDYDEIKHLRKIAMNHIYMLFLEEKEIEEKIKNENNKWFFNVNKSFVNELNEKKMNLKKQIFEKIKNYLMDKSGILSDKDNNDYYNNLPDDFKFYIAKINIKKFQFKICDILQDNIDDNKNLEVLNDLLDLKIKDLSISYVAEKYNTSYSLVIKDLILSQNIVINEEYDKIMIAESKSNEEFILIEYKTNNEENGNYINKIIFKSGIQIILFINLYQIQYINYNILSCLYAFISFTEISKYANENINENLQLGFIINENNKIIKKKKQQKSYTTKYEYDINLKEPIIIIPQDILNSMNKNCIIITAEEFIIKSNLVKEETPKNTNTINTFTQENNNESKSNYESCLNDSSIVDNIYDKHYLNINGIQVSLSNYCTSEDNYESIENICIHYFNISILYKTLIDINDNNNYNASSFTLDINELYFSLDELQILFLLNCLKELQFQNEYLRKNNILNDNSNDAVIKKLNDDEMKKFIEDMELKEILPKEEIILFKKDNINKEINITNDTIDEDYFYKNQNKFFMEIKLGKIKFAIYKIYPDLSKANFLQLELNSILFSKFNSVSEDSLMKIYLKNIILFDKEQDYKKNFILPKEFQLLIKSNEENNNINCIQYSSLYKKNKNEYLTNIEINNVNILSSFDTLTSIYTFFMYYYQKYQLIYYDEKINKKDNNDNKKKIHIRKSLILIQKEFAMSNIDKIIKQYKISNQNILYFKLRNSFFRIPSDDKNTEKPIFSMKLNIFYEQLSNSETENYYNMNNKTLIKGKLLFDNRSMNIMICESDFDMIYYNQKEIINDKIMSNYRIQYNSKYTYLLSKKNLISNMNITVEPLIMNMNLYQLKYIINLYYSLMDFLFKSLYSSYIPFLKQEDVIFIKGKPIVVKRKINLKKLIKYIYRLNKFKKALYKIKQKKKKTNKNIINSFSSINFQLDKVYVNILDENYLDNQKKEKRVLLELEIGKLFFNKIYNSNPKDKTNIGNELLSIITDEPISFEKYIKHNLYNYMICTFTLGLNHYNLEHSDFEPIIEPFDMEYLSYQTNSIFRAKTFINIKNMININVSTNSMKILNIFLSKYTKDIQNEKPKDIIEKKPTKSNEFLSLISKEINNNIEEQEEVVKITNKTGVFIYFWFDFDKENKIKIKKDETIHLTNKQIYKIRKNRKLMQKKERDKNTFSFSILNYEPIRKINFNSTDNLYFKTKINIGDKQKYLLYNMKIDHNSFIKEIIFESSIMILNESKFDDLILSLNEDYCDNNRLILEKNKKVSIPLNWIISSNNIFLQFNQESEKYLVYNNISEIIPLSFEEISQEEINEKEKQIENIKNSLEKKLNNTDKINLYHPKYKDYVSTFILQRFNKKNSKLINIKDQNNDEISFYFDYCSLKFKPLQSASEKVYQFLEYSKKSTEYMILIRPIANITNYTPFNMICYNNKDDSSININKNETLEIYNYKCLCEEYLIKLDFIYDNEDYETEYLNLYLNNNFINTINFVNKSNDILNCNLSHHLLNKNMNIFDQEFDEYSLLSYNYILFFDYIVNNRLEFDLFGINSKLIKDVQNNVFKFISESLSIFSSNKGDIHHLLINSDDNNFDKDNKINVNAVDIENIIEVEYEKNIYHILCKTSNSLNYIYSNILLLAPKFILINCLDLNVYYQQINEDMKPIDIIREVHSRKFMPLIYKTEKKLLFRIGINKTSFSGSFELDSSLEYELKVEVDYSYKKKYPINTFDIGNKLYLYFRIKNKITEEGNVYIYIKFPQFPLLEIDNRTNEQIKIFENKEDKPIIINPLTKIPFIFNNNIKSKYRFECQILNVTQNLTFNDYSKKKIQIDENKFIHIYSKQKNLLTGTRCITFVLKVKLNNKKKKFRKFESFLKKFSTLSRINIFIKGIGLSFLDEVPKEIFYISFYEISLIHSNFYKSSSIKEKYLFTLKNFQIDSSLNNTIKTLIYPKNQNIPSLELDNEQSNNNNNFISLSIVQKKYINKRGEITNMKYLEIALCIQELNIKIDQNIVLNLINLIKGYTSKLEYFNSSNIEQDFKEEEKLKKINMDLIIKDLKNEKIATDNKILINDLFISDIIINLSFRLDISKLNISYMPKIISKIIGSVGSSLIRLSDIPIKLEGILTLNIYSSVSEIIQIIIKDYINNSKLQILKILGNSDLIGSPVLLIEKIGTGFFDLVNEPRKGLLTGEIGKGISNGISGLLSGVIGGTFNSVSKISGTLYDLIQNLTGGNNELMLDEDYEPSDVITGASKGFMGGLQELYNGINGFINPIEKASNSDYNKLNLFKDLGKGLFKFAVSPINFILRIGNSISTGTFNYFYNKNIKNRRFRFPRYIKPNSLLTIYYPDLSAAKEFLFKAYKIDEPNILYFSDFFCENKRYYGKTAFFILTDEFILLLSNEYNVILNISLLDVIEIELKYNGKCFEFVFILNEQKHKIILINKNNNAFACELYYILGNIIYNQRKYELINSENSLMYVKGFKKALEKNLKNKKIKGSE